jgi:hypothetical protein
MEAPRVSTARYGLSFYSLEHHQACSTNPRDFVEVVQIGTNWKIYWKSMTGMGIENACSYPPLIGVILMTGRLMYLILWQGSRVALAEKVKLSGAGLFCM